MTVDPENLPGYRAVRITSMDADSPVAELAAIDSVRRRADYPNFVHAGAGSFGAAREREEGGWELLPYFGQVWPQESRDILSHDFRRMATRAEEAAADDARDQYTRAYRRLEREVINELEANGTRYRIVRATPFIRNGPNGPEPPRPSDPDPDTADADSPQDPAVGLIVDPARPVGLTDGLVLMELLQAGWPEGSVSHPIRLDEAKAALLHPGGVLLPTVYTLGERTAEGSWKPTAMGTYPTPQKARDALIRHLRVRIPWQRDLTDEETAAYRDAGDQVEAGRLDEVSALGESWRVVRVTRLLRFGPDGPEGPRDSDPDQSPIYEGLALDEDPEPEPEDPDENVAPDFSEDELRLMRLFEEEQARRQKRKASKGDNPSAPAS
jgi:Family of unknown function (DUF5954)